MAMSRDRRTDSNVIYQIAPGTPKVSSLDCQLPVWSATTIPFALTRPPGMLHPAEIYPAWKLKRRLSANQRRDKFNFGTRLRFDRRGTRP
jgi:hypothetical protein